jgi:hypothetical protein
MTLKLFLLLFFAVPCFAISFSQGVVLRIVTVSFKLDLSTELKKVNSLSSIGIRGNTAPLSWDKTYPMTDNDKDGIYETTIKLEITDTNQYIKYKYFHDTASWENSSDRVITAKENELILPVDKWNQVSRKNTAVYKDSIKLRELSITITRLDSILFNAYNNCGDDKYLMQYDSFFSDDHEFYHDGGGLTTSKRISTDGVKRNVCGKVKRELLKGSIEVSPVPGYGAVEMGSHRFYNIAQNTRSRYAKFILIWQYKNNEWKVTRVISLH